MHNNRVKSPKDFFFFAIVLSTNMGVLTLGAIKEIDILNLHRLPSVRESAYALRKAEGAENMLARDPKSVLN